MGLGPPVCEKCLVLGKYMPEDHLYFRDGLSHGFDYWKCPICLSINLKENLFTCGLTIDDLEANLRFLEFMKGPQE